jgi:hypothetical protein
MAGRLRNHGTPPRERGIAMIAILTLIALVGIYLLVTQLRNATGFTAERRNHNAQVLSQAKQALIGWVAQRAALAGEGNPGRLPCPEHPAYPGDPTKEGIAAPAVGISSPNCTMVGRLPWRTLGIDKLVDSSNEPLWYVVSPGTWSLQSSSTQLKINSNTLGALTVDGTPNAAVALIIAPGAAMNVQAATGCTARAQTRSAPAPGMNPLDYIECFNVAASSFATMGPSDSFNDQVLRITTADIMPEIEAAIAERIRREIAPVIKGVYASSQWGLTAANPMFAFAAPFANPGPGAGTSSYQGEYNPANPARCPNVAPRCQGLLPFTYSQGGCGSGDPRCSTGFVSWNTLVTPTITATNGIIVGSPTCNFNGTIAQCSGFYAGLIGQTVRLQMTARANNVAMALKSLNPGATAVMYTSLLLPGTTSVGGTFNPDGSANVTTTGAVPGYDASLPLGVSVQFQITADIGVLADHALLSSSDPTTGWFVRNEWYRLLYYAPALGNTAAGVPTPSCTTGSTCLSVANVAPANKQRAILILAGRSLTNPAGRPNGNLADYLEFGNADGDTSFEQQPVSTVINAALKAPFNDRIIVLDANP